MDLQVYTNISFIDFKTIQQKIDLNEYKTFDAFVEDVQLIFDNCRQYNPESSIYAKNARHMDGFFKKLLTKHEKDS
jgi:histone acetyltransferase